MGKKTNDTRKSKEKSKTIIATTNGCWSHSWETLVYTGKDIWWSQNKCNRKLNTERRKRQKKILWQPKKWVGPTLSSRVLMVPGFLKWMIEGRNLVNSPLLCGGGGNPNLIGARFMAELYKAKQPFHNCWNNIASLSVQKTKANVGGTKDHVLKRSRTVERGRVFSLTCQRTRFFEEKKVKMKPGLIRVKSPKGLQRLPSSVWGFH